MFYMKTKDIEEETILFNSGLLADLRRARKLSLRKLSNEVSISHSLLCNYETKRRIPTLRNLARLEDFFGLARGRLLHEDQQQKDSGAQQHYET